MAAPKITHYVAYDQPGDRFALALCGRRVDRAREHSAQPTCPICAEKQAAWEALPDFKFGSTESGAQS